MDLCRIWVGSWADPGRIRYAPGEIWVGSWWDPDRILGGSGWDPGRILVGSRMDLGRTGLVEHTTSWFKNACCKIAKREEAI